MALIQVPYYVPGDDSGRGSTTAYADTNTGKYYWDPAGNNPMVLTVNTGESLEQQWVGTDPKTDPILSDPVAVKMLQSGYIPYEGLQNVYIKPDSGQIAVSPNTSGIDKIYGGFARGLDPQTGGVVIGDRSNSGAIVNRAIDYRNSIYTGGDGMSNFLGAAAPAIMMGGVGALAAAPALAAAIPEATAAPEIAAELAGLQASTTGLGSGIGAQSVVDQLISNLPSVSTMAQNAAINAATQLVTTGDIDPSKVLTSVATGAAGTAVGATVAQDVLQATDSALAASIASGAAKGALQAAITGGDPLQTALASAAASGLGSVAKDAGISIPQPVINSVVGSVASGAPLDQVLTGAAIAAGTGLAKDAISSAYNAYNADQQTSGLQASSDLGNAPVQGFDNNGNSIYRDSSGVWTNGQGVQVDPATGEPVQEVQPTATAEEYSAPTQVAGTQDTSPLSYKTDYTGSYVSDTGEVPPIIGDYPVQQMPEILVEDQQPATTGLPDTTLPTPVPLSTDTTTNPTPTTVATPITTTVPVATTVSGLPSTSGTPSGSSGSSQKATDVSQYVNPIPAYLQPTLLSTGQPSQVSSLWAGLDPKLANILTQRFAHGGSIHPQLMKVLQERGGDLVPGPENRLYMRHAKRGFAVEGPGTGQSDDIPTMLADGEYVFDADTVAALGDGSSKAGAEVLDKMREAIRAHKRSAPVDKIPPKAKSPLEYLKMAKRK